MQPHSIIERYASKDALEKSKPLDRTPNSLNHPKPDKRAPNLKQGPYINLQPLEKGRKKRVALNPINPTRNCLHPIKGLAERSWLGWLCRWRPQPTQAGRRIDESGSGLGLRIYQNPPHPPPPPSALELSLLVLGVRVQGFWV